MRDLNEDDQATNRELAHHRKRDKKYAEQQKELNQLERALERRDLSHLDVRCIDLQNRVLVGIRMSRARLLEATLSNANLTNAHIEDSNLNYSKLRNTILQNATIIDTSMHGADLSRVNLMDATLVNCDLRGANLSRARLQGASLAGANLAGANLSNASLSDANLEGANLMNARLIRTDFTKANLANSKIFGIAVWKSQLTGANQTNLLITPRLEPQITVDGLDIAQFIYLLLNNQKITAAIDAVTAKAVLILGRFTPERKAILDLLRVELRNHGYVPILFDFDIPESRDTTETVTLLAHIVRFIVADLTDPSSIPKELESIAPTLAVPIQPLLEGFSRPFSMFADNWKYDWVLSCHWYNGQVVS
jgi:uncharacterized protein YjbI with pentapeptide repeats